MDTVRSRLKRWLGHILRHDSSLRITLEGQIQGKKVLGRPRIMFLDWILKTEEGNYEELKMLAQDRSRWSQWRWKAAISQNIAERSTTLKAWIINRDGFILIFYRIWKYPASKIQLDPDLFQTGFLLQPTLKSKLIRPDCVSSTLWNNTTVILIITRNIVSNLCSQNFF